MSLYDLVDGVVTRDCFHDIERDLITQYRALNKYDPYAVQGWYWCVAGWLLAVPDQDTREQWLTVFAGEMQAAHVGMPFHLCVWVLLHYMDESITRRVPDGE